MLIWRNWEPLYDFPATYSALSSHGIGGTETQLLWHAMLLAEMGHAVQVLGVTTTDITESGVDFVGAGSREDQERALAKGRVRRPDIVLLEGAFDAGPLFKALFPKAKIVHVGHNIDRHSAEKAFRMAKCVDVYAMVGHGQFAYYSVTRPQLRHKFCLLRNIVPWYTMYSGIEKLDVQPGKVVWVGGWTKEGLRHWAETMQQVLSTDSTVTWTLCGPSYGLEPMDVPGYIFSGLRLPARRIRIKNMPLPSLFQEICSAQVVLVSLGNETGSVSALDSHAAGRPVLSGNDVVYKYCNPEGTGIRVRHPEERLASLRTLLGQRHLCDELGARGQALVLREYTERNQLSDLESLVSYLEIRDQVGGLAEFAGTSRWREVTLEMRDKVRRKTTLRAAARWS